jgi:signal transduction histidine kinase
LERSVTHESGSGPRRFELRVALDHAEIDQLREAFTYDLAKVLALLAVLLVTGGFAQLYFGLKPFERLHFSLGLLRDGCVSRLEGDFPVEVAPLVADLNRLLDRHDNLIEKARARAGSLAHGLKTPMTILSGEVRRLEEGGQGEVAATLREQCETIHLHVERELAKARTHGAVRSSLAPTDVRGLVERLVDLMRKVDTQDRIRWKVDVPEGVTTAMEAGDFAEIVGNLLDNARKWECSAVRVTYAPERDGGRLSIADDGPGVDERLRGSLLDRGVHAANAPGGSTGIGLSIAMDTLEEYGFEITIDTQASGCCISFPLAKRGANAAAARPFVSTKPRDAVSASCAKRVTAPDAC